MHMMMTLWIYPWTIFRQFYSFTDFYHIGKTTAQDTPTGSASATSPNLNEREVKDTNELH